MSNPLVSIIIPVYNRERSVKRAVDSVLAQTFKDYEVVVVDDGSHDGSVAILKNYGGAIRLICQENAGVAAARNAGIRASRGKWITFLDSDDEWRSDKLDCQMHFLQKYGVRICYSGCVAENGESLPYLANVASTLKEPEVYWVAEPLELLIRSPIHPPVQAMVVDRELFDAAGYFDPTLYAAEDTLWIFKLSFLGPVLYVDRPLTVIHRYSDNSLTYNMRPEAAKKRFDSMIQAHKEMYARLREARPEMAGITRGRLAYHLSCRAELACADGEFKQSRALAWQGLTHAGNARIFLHCFALWLAPWFCRAHFRKKWQYP